MNKLNSNQTYISKLLNNICSTLLFLIIILTTACNSDFDTQQREWQQNQDRIKRLYELYPSFVVCLNSSVGHAKQLAKEANAVADKQVATDKLLQANSLINNDFIAQLASIDGLLLKLHEQRREVLQTEYSGNELKQAQEAADMAADVLFYTAKNLQKKPSNMTEAEQVVTEALKNIAKAQEMIDDL